MPRRARLHSQHHSTGTLLEAGKRHGAHPEDVYGCFYFYLSEQLRGFAHRLRTTKVTFTALCSDARTLPGNIHKNVFRHLNISSSARFDRIVTSNILDADYIGMHDVLTLWTPLLEESRNAAVVGYFMNWVELQDDARAAGDSSHESTDLLRQVMWKNQVSRKKLN